MTRHRMRRRRQLSEFYFPRRTPADLADLNRRINTAPDGSAVLIDREYRTGWRRMPIARSNGPTVLDLQRNGRRVLITGDAVAAAHWTEMHGQEMGYLVYRCQFGHVVREMLEGSRWVRYMQRFVRPFDGTGQPMPDLYVKKGPRFV